MDTQNLVESNHSEEEGVANNIVNDMANNFIDKIVSTSVNTELLESIKNFMDDLSTVTTSDNFKDYHTIVKRIDKTKVKAYHNLVKGFTTFFSVNSTILTEDGNFDELVEPNISYSTDNGSFSFNLQEAFHIAEEADQDVIKDHLNHIWNILQSKGSPEEKYIDKIFRDLKARFSPDLTREEQMMIAKDLFSDFQKQDLDISVVVKVACQKARELLLKNGADNSSQTMVLIEAVEEIDINNFNMIQFMGLVGKVGTLFSDGENNPLSGLLSSVFDSNNLIEGINVEDNTEDGDEDH